MKKGERRSICTGSSWYVFWFGCI